VKAKENENSQTLAKEAPKQEQAEARPNYAISVDSTIYL
jgi:hypothetical protein